MIAWLKTYAKTHLFYIILIVGGIFAFQTWLAQHDARKVAEAQVKADDQQVKLLQDGIAARDKALSVQQQQTIKIVHDVQTPAQAIAAAPVLLPDLAPSLEIKPAPDDTKAVEVQAMSFTALLGEFKDARDEAQTCQVDLADTKKQLSLEQDSVKVLKKKPGFWHRVGSVAKAVGIGVLTGIVIAKAGKL